MSLSRLDALLLLSLSQSCCSKVRRLRQRKHRVSPRDCHPSLRQPKHRPAASARFVLCGLRLERSAIAGLDDTRGDHLVPSKSKQTRPDSTSIGVKANARRWSLHDSTSARQFARQRTHLGPGNPTDQGSTKGVLANSTRHGVVVCACDLPSVSTSNPGPSAFPL